MDEQLLKDFIATVQAGNYDYDVAIAKFPELAGFDTQLLKDYVATAEKDNYDYEVINVKFPEFDLTAKTVKKKGFFEVTSEDPPLVSEQEVGTSDASGVTEDINEYIVPTPVPQAKEVDGINVMEFEPPSLEESEELKIQKIGTIAPRNPSKSKIDTTMLERAAGVETLEDNSIINETKAALPGSDVNKAKAKTKADEAKEKALEESEALDLAEYLIAEMGLPYKPSELAKDREKISELALTHQKTMMEDKLYRGEDSGIGYTELTGIRLPEHLIKEEEEKVKYNKRIIELRDIYAADKFKGLADSRRETDELRALEEAGGDKKLAEKNLSKELDKISKLFLTDTERIINKLQEERNYLDLKTSGGGTLSEKEKERKKTIIFALREHEKAKDFGTGQMFDVVTGEFIENERADKATVDFNKILNEEFLTYENSGRGDLEKRRDELWYSFNTEVMEILLRQQPEDRGSFDIKRDKDGNVIPMTKDEIKLQAERQSKSAWQSYGALITGGSKNSGDFSDAINILNSPHLYSDEQKAEANELFARFIGINRALHLNEDPGSLKEGGFLEGLVESFDSAMDGTKGEKFDKTEVFMTELKSMGIPLTEEQEKEMGQTFSKTLGVTVGESALVMADIAAGTYLLGGAGSALKIPARIRKLSRTLGGGNKVMQFGYNVALQSAAYEMAGQSGFAGAGEYAAESSAGAILEKLGSKNAMLNFVLKLAAGTTGETIAEYTGGFAENLYEGGDIQRAAEDTFGKTKGEAAEIFALTFITSLMFSSVGLTSREIANSKRNARDMLVESGSQNPVVTDIIGTLTKELEAAEEQKTSLTQKKNEAVSAVQNALAEAKKSGGEAMVDGKVVTEATIKEIEDAYESKVSELEIVDVNEYRRTSKDEKNPEVKKLKEQIEGLRDEDGLIPQDKKTELDRLNKAIAEVEAQPTSEVEVTDEAVFDRIKEIKGEDSAYTREEFDNIKKILETENEAKLVEAQQASEVDNQSKIDEINKKKEESKNNPVKEPKEYAKAVDDYKSTDLGSNEDAKNKKEAVVKQAQTKEGKAFVENQVAQMDYNEDGTITVYRSGTLQEGHNPATTNKQTAEIISSERKKQGLSSDIIEIKIQPSDISAVVPGIESEVLININKANSDRIKKGTKKEQKNKEQLTLEKESVKNELEKTTQALKNAKKDKADGTFKFSDNVYNDVVKKQEAKIKNLEWQLKKYDAEIAALEPTTTSEVEAKKAEIEEKSNLEITEVEEYVDELDKTKKSDPKVYWSVSEVSEVDAKEGTVVNTEDGSALVKKDGDIVGVFKKITSKAKGVAQDLLKRAVKAGGTKLDNFDGYLTKQYEKAGFRVVSRTPFNEEYAPEGWDKDAHGTPDVVAMVYDPKGELDIEEKSFNDYDEAISYRDSMVPETKVEKNKTVSGQTLSAPKPTSDVEAKKAEIERRRQEELSSLTPEQEFIKSIFPDTKVKEVVYHGSKSKTPFEIAKTEQEKIWPDGSKSVKKGFYVTKEKSYAEAYSKEGHLVSAVVNVENPLRSDKPIIQGNLPKLNNNQDSIIGTELGATKAESIILFKPEQIHILTEGEKSKIDNEENKSKINAKYDAELAALEPTTTQKRGESLATEFKKMEASKKDTSKIEEQVENAKKAIAKVSPKTKIVVHKTAKDYKNSGKNRKQNEGGEYDIEKDTIHINLESANERTIAHEVFHALLLSKGMSNKQAKAVTEKMLKAVKKTASPELLKKLEDFSGRYILRDEAGNPILDKDGNTIPDPVQSEESIAELFGILAAGYPTLPKPTQNIIKRWLDKLAKLFGLKMFTDNEVVDMLNVVSKKVKEGVEISEKELKPIRKKVDIEKEFEGGIPVDELTDEDLDQDQTSQWGESGSDMTAVTRKQITEESIENSRVDDINTDYTYVFDDYGRGITLPNKQTIKSVLEKSGGYAVFINSDGTKVGVRSNGEMLDGGWQYSLIDENVESKIGFAATSATHVKTLHKMVSELTSQRDTINPKSKGKPITVFVTVQNGETMLGEWYAGEYFFEGIDKAITENKFKNGVDTFKSLITDAVTYTSKINASRKKIRELNKQSQTAKTKKNIEALKKRIIGLKKKASNRETIALLKLINSDKFKTHDGRIEIAKEFASKKFTFGFRVNLLKTLIPLKSPTGGNVEIKKALLDVGYGRKEFYQEHLDGSLLDHLVESNYDETSIGGITLGGFYIDPYVSMKEFFDNRKNGIDHAQFNESFSSNGEVFRLDGAHNVNALNPHMGYPTTNGYAVYNKENGSNINKKNASIEQRHDIVTYLDNKYGNKKDGKNLFALPFTSIGGSMYTPTDSEIEFNDSPKKPSRSRKQLPADTQRSRKQIVGENAELSDNVRDNLSVAREMGTANKDTKTIRIATGWEKGADGKWRYEIDDVLIKDDFSYKDLKRIPSGLYSGKLSDVINNEKLFDSYSTRFTQEVDILNDDGSVEDFKRTDNYPPISDIKVYFEEVRGGTDVLAEYDPFFKTITINIQPGNSTNKQISTGLLHEIQHYIQGREGFARGGNSGMFDNEMDTLSFGNVNALRSFAKDVAIKNPEKGWDITYGSDAVKKYEEIFGEKPSPTVVTLASVLEQQLSRGIDVDETTVYKTLKNNNLTSFEKYKRLAGEVESRNVEKRKDMTPEQRRETTLQETEDVAREDQIFFTEETTTRSRKQLPADTQRSRKQRTTRLAPNKKQSNLTDVQYDMVRTPAFKKWFGDWETDPANASKVVDENGEPMVMYHGTNANNIEEFDRNKSERTSSRLKEFGTYFASNKKLSDMYAEISKPNEAKVKSVEKRIAKLKSERETVRNNRDFDRISEEIKSLEKANGRVYEVFLNLRNVQEFDAEGGMGVGAWNKLEVKASHTWATNRDAMEFLMEGTFGVDKKEGVIAKNVADGSFQTQELIDEHLGDVVLVFDTTKKTVKLADGSNTTFDPESNNIRKQLPADDLTKIEAVRKLAQEKGYTEAELKVALEALGFSKAEINSTKKTSIDGAKDKYELSRKRGNSFADAVKAALGDLESTTWYSITTDTKRNAAVKELKESLGEKIEKAPSVKKIMGDKSKPEKQTKTVKSLRKEFWKMWNKAFRDSKIDQDTKRKEISEAISDIINESRGDAVVKKKKLDAIQKRINRTNLNNPVMVERLLNYIEKVMVNADHIAKIAEANKNKTRIRNLTKKGEKDANLTASAKAFIQIDPNLVEDIDLYLEKSNEIVDGLKPTSITPNKNNVSSKFNTVEMDKYTEKELSNQQDKIKASVNNHFEELTGISGSGMSLSEMMEVIEIMDDSKEAKPDISKLDPIEKANIKKAYDAYASIVLAMAKTNTDPFTGESLGLSKEDIALATKLANLDILDMNKVESIKAIDALSNFTVNQSLAGAQAIVSIAEGNQNTNKLAEGGVKTRKLKQYFSKGIGRLLAEQLMSLPLVMERMYGKTKAIMVSRLSGLTGVINGNAKATKMSEKIVSSYLSKFGKTKPNKQEFNTAENIHERGVIAFMMRTVSGNEEAEFKRRKGWIEQSIAKLSEGTKEDKAKSEAYQEVYDKLLKDSDTIEDVLQKSDKKNIEAVNWWVNEWSKHYDQLQKTNLEVYNEILDSDGNYTPDVTKKMDEKREVDLLQSTFASASGRLDKAKSGSLIKATKPKKIPLDRYISLDFDVNNANTIQSALIDINTAKDILKLQGFLNSPALKEIIETKEDRDLFKRRIYDYVSSVKRSNHVDRSELQNLSKGLEIAAAVGVARALGGVTQGVKQTIPVMLNTLINSGRLDFSNLFNSDVRAFIDNSGMPIANRGMASQASLDHIERLLEKASKTRGGALVKNLEDLQRFYLKLFLQNPDVFVARASFISYYKQALNKKGKKVEDWSTHELDQEAADYAQQQVDRQQNVSDEYLQGKLFTSKNPIIKIVRKTAFPFANFAQNQKARMATDMVALAARTTSKSDRVSAMRSLSGLSVEMMAFYSLRILIATGIWSAAKAWMGYNEDDEEADTRMKNQMKGSYTSMAKDLLSPVPMLDAPAIAGMNKLLNVLQGDLERDKEGNIKKGQEENFEFFGKYKEGLWDDWGVLGIAADKVDDMFAKTETAVTGKYIDKGQFWNVERTLTEKNQEGMMASATLSILYNLGVLPSEFGTLSNNIEKISKKRKKK